MSLGKKLINPTLRLWTIMAGVLALILQRTLFGVLIYPPVVIWVVGAGTLGMGALAVVLMVRNGKELLPSAGQALLAGGVMFAIVFGLTWLLG